MTRSLPAAFDAETGVTCLVGAGGKKTTLYALAARLDRAVLTATVRIPIFDAHVETVRVTDDPVAALGPPYPLGLVPERDRGDRYRGYDAATVDRLAAAHDGPVLVKADGARTRLFKAPDDDEPQIPAHADVVVPVVSARVVGEPLSEETVHRPERVAALTGLDVGDAVTAADVATVLAHPEGGLKGVPEGATVIPLVNMVDDASLAETGHAIADDVHDRASVDRVVLARMDAPEVVDVV